MPSITLTVDATQAQRLGSAYGRLRGLRDAGGNLRSATLNEVKQELILYAKGVVIDQEAAAAREVALSSPADFVAT